MYVFNYTILTTQDLGGYSFVPCEHNDPEINEHRLRLLNNKKLYVEGDYISYEEI